MTFHPETYPPLPKKRRSIDKNRSQTDGAQTSASVIPAFSVDGCRQTSWNSCINCTWLFFTVFGHVLPSHADPKKTLHLLISMQHVSHNMCKLQGFWKALCTSDGRGEFSRWCSPKRHVKFQTEDLLQKSVSQFKLRKTRHAKYKNAILCR